ncbi:hypothetical protein C8R47DRAFT_1112781 [Mycena vitilis]|nr:hypothetical protein C8R47DRAFT_1112781 [Mycena vitilis]
MRTMLVLIFVGKAAGAQPEPNSNVLGRTEALPRLMKPRITGRRVRHKGQRKAQRKTLSRIQVRIHQGKRSLELRIGIPGSHQVHRS